MCVYIYIYKIYIYIYIYIKNIYTATLPKLKGLVKC